MSKWRARSVLAALALLLTSGLLVRVPPQPMSTTRGQGDAAFYRTVVGHIQQGETYYQALGGELRRRGYPTASVFNWRTPAHLAGVAAAPRAAAIALLALGAFAVVATLALLLKAPPEMLLVSLLLQVGAAMSILIVPDSVMVAEVWAGYLVFLSVIAYAKDSPLAGAVFAIEALFVRELAAPFCVAAGALALVRRRWKEGALWVLGACAYGAYFAMHAVNVHAQLAAGARAHSQSYVQFGGLPFVLGTIGFSGWFAALPHWVTAIGCVLIVASAWSRAAPLHLRIAAIAYVVFFAIVGQVFNQNWGLVAAPAWALACGYGIDGLKTLVTAAR
jgi:hypothetical protein